MNNLLKLKALVIMMITTLFVSCSSDGLIDTEENGKQDSAKENVYEMILNCPVPGFDGETSRATSWANGSVVYLEFKNGDEYITGKATYSTSTSSWTIATNTSLPTMSSATGVSAYYVENPSSTSGDYVYFSTSSILYYGYGTYTASSTKIYVNVTMKPNVGRLRFKGTSGTSVTLKKSDNMIDRITLFYKSTSAGYLLNAEKQDISLSVKSNGYTDYIYGNFEYISGTDNRTITVTTDATYQRTDIDEKVLYTGKSACLTVPTNSNYASLGWTKVGGGSGTVDKNAYVKPDLLVPFTDGWATNWTVGSTANTFYFRVFSSISGLSDDDIINSLKSSSSRDAQEYTQYISGAWSSSYSPNTTYYLYIIAYNAAGEQGPLQKYEFKTNSTSLPIAELSNLKTETIGGENKWTYGVSLKNGAKKYYLWNSEKDSDISQDEHWHAWELFKVISDGSFSNTYDWTSVMTTKTSSQFIVFTYAVDTYGKLGNYSFLRYPASSAAKQQNMSKNSNVNSDIKSVPKNLFKKAKEFDIHPFMVK